MNPEKLEPVVLGPRHGQLNTQVQRAGRKSFEKSFGSTQVLEIIIHPTNLHVFCKVSVLNYIKWFDTILFHYAET